MSENRMRRFAQPVLVVVFAACTTAPPAVTPPADPVAEELASLLASVGTESARVPGAMLRVESPGTDLIWTGSVGVSDLRSDRPLRPDQTLRIASNTKTYVAAAILRLVEEGLLETESPIHAHLSPATTAALRADGYDPRLITVRMLLEHTSGLFDHATSPEFLQRVISNPGHRWTRAEQVALAMSEGDPLAAPGDAFHYSDTGYALLGEILEQVTSQPMNEAIRRLVDFDRLGLRFTWFETLDRVPPHAPERAHQYFDGTDATHFDPSFDLWGGGGIVSNVEELARFYAALLQGGVFRRPETLASMLTPSPQSLADDGTGYGMGIGRVEYDGITCYGHGGYWGTLVRHCPELDLTVAAAVTSASATTEIGALMAEAIAFIAAAVADPARADAGTEIR